MNKARVSKRHLSEFTRPLIVTKGDVVNCVDKPTNFEGWVYYPDFKSVD